MWLVAVIQGHFDPWHPRIINKVEAQLDAILEAYSEEFPRKLKFERKSNVREREKVEILSTQWADKLTGEARVALRDSKFAFSLPEKYRRARPGVRQPPATNQAKTVRQMPRGVKK